MAEPSIDFSDLSGALQLFRELSREAEREFRVVNLPCPNTDDTLPMTVPVALVPAGHQITEIKKYLDPWRERPERIADKARITDIASFRDYLLRFRTDETAVFVNVEDGPPTMTAVFDFHSACHRAAGHCAHTATYPFPVSEPFRAWLNVGKGLLTQQDFAEFLADHEYDIENPPVDWSKLPADELDTVCALLNIRPDPGASDAPEPAHLPIITAPIPDAPSGRRPLTRVEKLRRLRFGDVDQVNALARGVEVAVGQKVKQSFDAKTGARSLIFEESQGEATQAGVKVAIPDLFLIYVPVFDSAERQLLPVRLFYRIKRDAVQWGLTLIDPVRLIRRAVEADAETVRTVLGEGQPEIPVYFGQRTA